MDHTVKIALAQLDLAVGDIAGNTKKIIEKANLARDELNADLIEFPELGVCGYPPEDLLFHGGFRRSVENAMDEIRNHVIGITVLLGFPEYDDDHIYNACAVFEDGKIVAHYRKQMLPNYSVFDEERYFTAGRDATVFKINGIRIGLNICEDIWKAGPMRSNRAAGAECVIVINGSPFEMASQETRENEVRSRIAEVQIPVVYINMVGGHESLVVDGGSFAMNADGDVCFRAPAFDEGLHTVILKATAAGVTPESGECAAMLQTEASVYRALVTGTRDYVTKHGFPGVIIGLSGGIDSALVATIACDAIGADRVRAVMMPFRFTSTMSQEDAAKQAATLGIDYDVITIEPMYEATIDQLQAVLGDREADVTEENIQARCRGLLLMAISNKTGRMLLTTGNKSETAVGYATLYGDMAGGFAPISECSQPWVYRVAPYRHTLDALIP